jgi:hypothetical protein
MERPGSVAQTARRWPSAPGTAPAIIQAARRELSVGGPQLTATHAALIQAARRRAVNRGGQRGSAQSLIRSASTAAWLSSACLVAVSSVSVALRANPRRCSSAGARSASLRSRGSGGRTPRTVRGRGGTTCPAVSTGRPACTTGRGGPCPWLALAARRGRPAPGSRRLAPAHRRPGAPVPPASRRVRAGFRTDLGLCEACP